MAGLSLGGLASGMDTDTIVSKLMQIEGQGKTRLLADQYRNEGRKTTLDSIATKLRALETAVTDLRSVSVWKNVQKVDSSDASKVAATYTAGAGAGSYGLEVTRLARGDQQFQDYVPDAAATKIQIQYSGDASSAVEVDIPANATLEQVAAAVNGKVGSAAYATVVSGQLVFSGKKTGVDLQISAPTLSEDAAKRRASTTAEYKIDGVTQPPSATNTITNGLPGVTLTLKSLTTSPVTVNVGAPGPDKDAIQAKVKSFVDTYNATVDLIKGELEEQTVKSPSTSADYAKGVLRGDPGLQAVLSKMRQMIGDKIPGNPAEFDQLSDIGIGAPKANTSGTSTAEALAGKISIDTEKLTAALEKDPTAIRRMMGGVAGVDGFSQKLEGLLDPIAKTGTGQIAERSKMLDREIGRIKERQTQMDDHLKLKEERLRKQFTAMETALSNTQSTTSWISSQIAGLGSWG